MNKFLCLLVLSLSSFEIYSEDKDYKYLICKPANKLFTPKDDDNEEWSDVGSDGDDMVVVMAMMW